MIDINSAAAEQLQDLVLASFIVIWLFLSIYIYCARK